MRATTIKRLLGVIAIVFLFGLMQTQSVIDALLLFAAAGVVPGTSFVLSPLTTMVLAGATLVAGLLMLVRRQIGRVLLFIILPVWRFQLAVALYLYQRIVAPWRGAHAP